MHSVEGRAKTNYCRRHLLAAWQRRRTALWDFFSLSRDEAQPLDELVCFFSMILQVRVVGVTPRLEIPVGKHDA